MAVLAYERRQPAVSVRCAGCGVTFELSVRNVLRGRAEGREPRCRACRRPRPSLTDVERTRYERYWLARFSREELVALADAWRPR